MVAVAVWLILWGAGASAVFAAVGSVAGSVAFAGGGGLSS